MERNFSKTVSAVGRAAKFGDAETEVARIVKHQTNYYIVLKVLKDTDQSEIRVNHLRLSRIVHPDKCSHPEAATASAILNQAANTLRDPIKKRLYDAYVSDLQEVDAPEGMSYAEWEAKQADVKIPKWVEKILKMPGGKFIMLIISLLIILVILLPLIIIGVVLALVLFILCLPCNLASRMRGKADGEGEGAADAAAGEQPATSAPTQQPYPTADANV